MWHQTLHLIFYEVLWSQLSKAAAALYTEYVEIYFLNQCTKNAAVYA